METILAIANLANWKFARVHPVLVNSQCEHLIREVHPDEWLSQLLVRQFRDGSDILQDMGGGYGW